MVIGRASNLNLFLCYIRKSCSVASIVGDPSDFPKAEAMLVSELDAAKGYFDLIHDLFNLT